MAELGKNHLTLEQIKELVIDPDFSFNDLVDVMKEGFDIELPLTLGAADKKGELASFIFDVYRKTAEKYIVAREEQNKKFKKKVIKVTDPDIGEISRSGYIRSYIQKYKKVKKDALLNDVDITFHYTEMGKSPRTRVSRTLKDLEEEGKITIIDDLIQWVG